MNILVLSCSPKNSDSVTLHSLRLLSCGFKKDNFRIHIINENSITDGLADKLREAELILMASPVIQGGPPSMLIEIFEQLENDVQLLQEIMGKPITLFTTSYKIGDEAVHEFVKNWALRHGLYWINSLSFTSYPEDIDRSSILTKVGREELYTWFEYVRKSAITICNKLPVIGDGKINVTIVDCFEKETYDVFRTVKRLYDFYYDAGADVKTVQLRKYNVQACTGCEECFATRKCPIDDSFESLTNEIYNEADIVVYAGMLYNGTLGHMHRRFMERHTMFGISPDMEGLVVAYVCTLPNNPFGLVDLACFEHSQSVFEDKSSHYVIGYFDHNFTEKAAVQTLQAVSIGVVSPVFGNGKAANIQLSRIAKIEESERIADYTKFDESGYYKGIGSSRVNAEIPGADGSESRSDNKLAPYKDIIHRYDTEEVVQVKSSSKREGRSFIHADKRREDIHDAIAPQQGKNKLLSFFKFNR